MSKSPAAKPVFKYVDFDLPFVLFLRDSMNDPELAAWVDALRTGKTPLPYARHAPPAGKPGALIIGGGLPVYLPPKEIAPLYEVALPEIVLGFRTIRRVNANRSMVLMGELPGDRTGRASFSTVRVIFPLSQVLEKFHWDMPLFCHQAVRAVNHFLEHYRVLVTVVPIVV